jgi:fatty acid desaturase
VDRHAADASPTRPDQPVVVVAAARRDRAALPPVAPLQQTAQAVLDPEQIDTLKRLSDKANAWLIVAGGAFLLAVAETWSLRQSYAWDEWVFWLLVVAMAAACALVTSYRVHRRGLRMERVPG